MERDRVREKPKGEEKKRILKKNRNPTIKAKKSDRGTVEHCPMNERILVAGSITAYGRRAFLSGRPRGNKIR